MSVVEIKAGLVGILRAVPGVGQVVDSRTGLPAWLGSDHRKSAYCIVTRDPNSPGEEEAVGVGPVVFSFTNVRIEVWLHQALPGNGDPGSQATWDDLTARITAAIRENKTLGGQPLGCDEVQPLVDDEQQATDGAAEIWLHHAIYLLRVRELVPYQPV